MPNIDTGDDIRQPQLFQRITDKKGRRNKPFESLKRGSPEWYHFLVRDALENRRDQEHRWRIILDEYNRGKQLCRDGYDSVYPDHPGDSNNYELSPARVYNLVHLTEGTLVPNRPKFFVEGFTADVTEGWAKIAVTALNNEWRRDFSLRREMKLCSRDCSRYGIGIMLTSIFSDRQEDPDEERKKNKEEKVSDPILSAVENSLTGDVSEILAESPTEEVRETFEGDSRIVKDRLYSRRVSPWDFFIDPNCNSEDDAVYMGREIVTSIDFLRADTSLSRRRFEVEGTSRLSDDYYHRDSRRRNNSPYELVKLYEIFERQPHGRWDMILIAEGHNFFLRKEKDLFWPGCPYDILRWSEDGEDFYPVSDAMNILPEVVAERVLYTKAFDGYCRETVDTFLYDEQAATEEDIHAKSDPRVGKWIKVRNPGNGPVRDLAHKLPRDAKSPEMLNLLSSLERSIQISSGAGPNQFGQALRSGTTATEANEVGLSFRARGSHKFTAMEAFTSGMAYKRLGFMLQFYTPADIVRLVGPVAARVWNATQEIVTKADVRYGLQVIVDPGSMPAASDQKSTQDLLQVLAVASQNPVAQALLNFPPVILELFERLGFQEGSKFVREATPELLDEVQGLVSLSQAQGGRGGSQGQGVGSAPAAQAGDTP